MPFLGASSRAERSAAASAGLPVKPQDDRDGGSGVAGYDPPP